MATPPNRPGPSGPLRPLPLRSRPFQGSVRGAQRLVWPMIGINTAVFAAWQIAAANRHTEVMQKHFVFKARDIKEGRPWTAITSAFSHFSLGHFAFNMFALHTFGSILAQQGIGPARFATVALGSGLAASAGTYIMKEGLQPMTKSRSENGAEWNPFRNPARRREPEWGALGASGIVMGVGAALTCIKPWQFVSLWGIIPVPMWAVTIGYGALDTYWLRDKDSTVGHAAHLSGLAFGVGYSILSWRRGGLGALHMWRVRAAAARKTNQMHGEQ